jgi:hypothetical protein
VGELILENRQLICEATDSINEELEMAVREWLQLQ